MTRLPVTRLSHAQILWVWPNSMYFDRTALYCTNTTTCDMGPINLSGGLLLTEKYKINVLGLQ